MSNDETQPVPRPQPAPAYVPAPAPRRNRGALILAGGAIGIALVAGTGGFALGHVTAGDDRDDRGMFGRPWPGHDGGPGPR